MKITYWSDYACPYCYIGESRLRKAIERLGLTDSVEVEMRAFELDPNAAREVTSATPERFARKYALTLEQANERIEGISEMGRAEGLDFNYATTKNTNTMDAHRLTKLAHDLDKPEIEELLYRAYFTDNRVLADHGVLREIARQAGLPASDVERVLNSDEYAQDVREDERQAYAMGVGGVPFFLVDGKYALSGCYPTQQLASVIARAAQEESPTGECLTGQACGIDGCGC